MTAVAFVGLGRMGSRMARRLLDAGHDIVAWNRTAARAAALGVEVAESPAEAAASADVVITMVSDPEALRAVTEGSAGISAGIEQSATVIEMSTVGPAAVSRLKSVLPGGVELLDAPVLGSLDEAESGSLRIFVGGSATAAARWTPLLSSLGTPIHVGPLGAGASAKLVANSTLFGVLGVLGEAIALAEALALSRDTAFEILAFTPVASQAERRRPSVEAGEYPPRFPLSLARKDADLVLEAAANYRKGLKDVLDAEVAPFLDERGQPEEAYRGAIRRLEERHKRRVRRAERDYVDWVLLAVSSMLRDRVAGAVGGGRDLLINLDEAPDPAAAIAPTALGLGAIEEARAALAEDLNLNPRLVLEQAFLRVAGEAAA